jgi:protein O-GlcNAc transferase
MTCRWRHASAPTASTCCSTSADTREAVAWACSRSAPAPLQGHFLGYPGTTGARFVDFFVADGQVLPSTLEHGFSESIARMPLSYQPNGRGRALTPHGSRIEHGLPAQGLVFCSFNQPIKITPRVFGRWCELLRAVEGSALWLLDMDARATANLRREARARGVEPARLVFAPRVPIQAHLARVAHADIALDTFPCVSHTTASDVIRAGVPLVTTRGDTFASRVASSVLAAAGCGDWIFDHLDRAFEATLALARSPQLREAARQRAQAAIDSALFDAPAYARAFEHLLLRLWREEPHRFAGDVGAGVQ